MSSGNRTPSSSIVSARGPKNGHPALPVDPNEDKVPVSRQWLLAVRHHVKKSLDRADYVVREIETRLYPTLRHADDCPAVKNDELHCLADRYETNHTTECLVSKTPREGENLEQASPICACPKTLVSKGCPDRELRMTLRCILESLIDLTEQAPIRKFGADDFFYFPSRDGYAAIVAEIEYLRERLSELDPSAAPRLGAPEIVRAPPVDVKDEADATATQTG